MKKYYVIFNGPDAGVYDNWDDVSGRVSFPGARYKGFSSSAEAAKAFREQGDDSSSPAELGRIISRAVSRSIPAPEKPGYMTNPEVDPDAWAVDASCLGNPGKMEYRGVELMTGRVLFTVGPFLDATNNIGEFLAIVHAMALMEKEGKFHNIYSDSVSGMAWVRTRKIKTQLKPTGRNRRVFELMARAVTWLNTHTFPAKVLKWQTDRWGEIPADFGRK